MSKTEVRKFYTCTGSPLHAVVVLMLILQMSIKTSGNHLSCEVSKSTVQFVEDCPDSEEKWREAVARKNCAAYASQCAEPEKLVYHCVVDGYINQILEVCAYEEFIVLGYCTYYNVEENFISPNFNARCKEFLKNPCPDVYHSTEAYKYQGCYELTKKSGKHFEEITQIGSSIAVISASTVSTVNRNGKEDVTYTDYSIAFIMILILNLIFCIGLLYFFRLLVKYNRLKSYDSG